MKKLIAQVLKFGVVGVIAFAIDYGVLILLTEVFGLYYLLSAMISFTVSVVFNYLASMKYVFRGREDISRLKEFIIFVVLSLIGLGLTELLMWLLVDKALIHYMVSKILVTGIVMVWNFVSRKLLLEEHKRE